MSSPEAGTLPTEAVQELLARAVRLYAERLEHDGAVPPFPPDASPPTATEVLRTVSAMLDAIDVEIFELGMWRAWGTRGGGG